MTDTQETRKGRRWLRWSIVFLIVLFLVLSIRWYLRSDYFAGLLKARVVGEVESATGGRVEIGTLQWKLSNLELDLRNVTVHGLEGPNEAPYIHADRIHLRAKVGSLFHRALGLRFLEIDRPVVHVIVYPDGSTNQPRPKGRKENNDSPIKTIFEFSINKADVRDGKLLINDRPMPLDFAAVGLDGAMKWFKPANRYDGEIRAQKIDISLEGFRPFSTTADAKFSLWPNAVELNSVTLSLGRTRLEASGRLDDFNKPTINLQYRGSLDLADIGPILRVPQARGGTLDVDGHATYAGKAYRTSGSASLHGAEWQESWVHVKNASVAANFVVDHTKISLSSLTGKVGGGTITGEGGIENWCTSCIGTQREQRGVINLRLVGASAREVASAFSTRSLPVAELNPAGVAGGSVRITWKGTISEAETAIDGFVVPPETNVAGELPVSAQLRATYRSKSRIFEASNMMLATPFTKAQASGAIGATSARLRVSAATTNLNEFSPLLRSVYGVKDLPLELHGQGSFNGTVSGSMSMPTISGLIEATDFVSSVAPNLSGAAPGTVARMHWDRLSTELVYGPKELSVRNGVLKEGSAELRFDGAAQLTKGAFTQASQFSGRIAVSRTRVRDLQTAAGTNYPVDGIADFELQLSGTRALPKGTGRVLVQNGTAYGETIDQLRANVSFVKNDIRLEHLFLSQRRGAVTGSVAYNSDTRAFGFDLRGNSVQLENLQVLQRPRLKVGGTLSFAANGTGTLDAPAVDADIKVAGLVLGNERIGELTAKARTSGDTLTLSSESRSDEAHVFLNGTVRMREDYPFNGNLRFDRADLRPLWASYMRGRLTGKPYATGQVAGRGSLRQAGNLQLTADVSELFLPVENMNVRNIGPVKFSISNQMVRVEQLHLAAEDTDVTAAGTFEYGGEQKLDIRAEGRVNLKIIQTMDPDFTSYGAAMVNLRLSGDMSNPRTVGRVQISNAGISYIDAPIGLSEINGSLAFNRDRLQVQNLTARTGGGTLNLSGYITYGRTVGFNLQAVGNDIRLRYPQGISSIANTNLKLTGSPSSAQLAGDVVITKFAISPQFDLGTYIARSKQPTPVPKPNSPLYNLKLDVHVTSSSELQVQTAMAKVSGNVDLRLRGSAARPAVLGRVNITEGDVSFQGTKYRVERGDVTFSNPAGIAPVFDVAATTRVRDYDITLGFHGSTDRLTTTYRSDPPLATADIIALLAFGRTREESARQLSSGQPMSEQASNAILGQALNATVSNRMQKLFGVSRIKIDPEVGGAENNPSSARVTIEQQVAKNLTVTYITDLAKANQQIISAEYNVTRAVSIVAVRDQYGIVSFDVRIRQRRK